MTCTITLDDRVLDAVRQMKNEPSSSVYIAKRLWISWLDTQKALARLEASGLVRRKSDPNDGWEAVE